MQRLQQQATPNSLRHYRRQRGLKQRDVADVLNIKNASMISRWENGHCVPHITNLVKLAVLYRTMVDAMYLDLRLTMQKEISKKEQRLTHDAGSDTNR